MISRFGYHSSISVQFDCSTTRSTHSGFGSIFVRSLISCFGASFVVAHHTSLMIGVASARFCCCFAWMVCFGGIAWTTQETQSSSPFLLEHQAVLVIAGHCRRTRALRRHQSHRHHPICLNSWLTNWLSRSFWAPVPSCSACNTLIYQTHFVHRSFCSSISCWFYTSRHFDCLGELTIAESHWSPSRTFCANCC